MAGKRRIGMGIAGLALLALVSGAVWHFAGDSGRSSSQGSFQSSKRKAPRFELPDPAGRKHALEELRGSWVVLHFWAAWCPPCLSEIPNWTALARTMAEKPEGKKIRFVAVSADPRWEDALKILPLKDLPEGMLSLLDASVKVAEEYGTYQFPETYLLNPQLEIEAKWVGAQEWTSPRMIADLTKFLGGGSSSKSDSSDLQAR